LDEVVITIAGQKH
jgi:putative transposase